MGETVEALGHKTDVTGRAKDAVSDRVQGVREKISGSTPDSGEVKEGAKRAGRGYRSGEPPGPRHRRRRALGFVAGLLVPSTSIEDEKISPVADDIEEKAKETGQEAIDRARRWPARPPTPPRKRGAEQAEELRETPSSARRRARAGPLERLTRRP